MKYLKSRSVYSKIVVLCAVTGALLLATACAGDKKNAKSSDDTFVPQETQSRSEKNYGQQQMMMEDLNMSTSERAGQRHDQRVRDMRDPDDEESSGQ